MLRSHRPRCFGSMHARIAFRPSISAVLAFFWPKGNPALEPRPLPSSFEEKKDRLRGQHPLALVALLEQGEELRDEPLQADLDKVSGVSPRTDHIERIS